MTCRNISTAQLDAIRASSSLEDAYVAARVRVSGDQSLQPPEMMVPTEYTVPGATLPGYLIYKPATAPGQPAFRAYNLTLLQNADARRCALQVLDYDEARDNPNFQKIYGELQGQKDSQTMDQRIEARINQEPEGTPRTTFERRFAIWRTLQIVAYLRTTGNKDQAPDAVTDNEIGGWALQLEKNDAAAARTRSMQILKRLNTLLGLVENFNSAETPAAPKSLSAMQTAPGGDVVIAPDAKTPFPADCNIFIDSAAKAAANCVLNDNATGITLPFHLLSAGNHTITIKNKDGKIFGMATVTITAATAPVPVGSASASSSSSATVLPDGGVPQSSSSGSATVIADAGADAGDAGVRDAGSDDAGVKGAGSAGGVNGPGPTGEQDIAGWIVAAAAVLVGVELKWAPVRSVVGRISSLFSKTATTATNTTGATNPNNNAGGVNSPDDLVAAAEAEARRLAALANNPNQPAGNNQASVVVNSTNFLDGTPADQIQTVTPQEHVVEAQIKAMYPWARDAHNAGTVKTMARLAIQQLQSTSRNAGLPTESHLELLREERHAAARANIGEGTVRAGVPETFLRKVVEQVNTSNVFVMNQLGFGSAADFSRVDAEARNLIENRRAEYHRAMEGFLPRP